MRFDPRLEDWRYQSGMWRSPPGAPYGVFYVPFRSVVLKVMADNGEQTGWEHVSVSLPNRCPNWEEMSLIKSLFFGDDETVVQFHPRRSDYVNIHSNCLHLWRRVGADFELPPQTLV